MGIDCKVTSKERKKYPFNLLHYFSIPFFNKLRVTEVQFLLLFHNSITPWCLAHYNLWLFGFQDWETGDNLMSSKHVHSCGMRMLCGQQSCCHQKLCSVSVVTVHLYSQLFCRDPAQGRIRFPWLFGPVLVEGLLTPAILAQSSISPSVCSLTCPASAQQCLTSRQKENLWSL